MMDDVEFIAEMEGKVNSGVEIRLPELSDFSILLTFKFWPNLLIE